MLIPRATDTYLFCELQIVKLDEALELELNLKMFWFATVETVLTKKT